MGMDTILNRLPLSGKRAAFIAAGFGIVMAVGTGLYTFNAFWQPEPEPSPAITPTLKSVSALGRIEPLGEVIQLSPPASLGGAKIAELLIVEGDRITAGQTVAILDEYSRLQAAVDETKQQVQVAQANLETVKAGAKTGEIEAARAAVKRLEEQLKGEEITQRATIARLEAELRNAESEFRRYQSLATAGAISESDLDLRRLNLETAQERVQEARSRLQQTRNTLNQQIQEAKANLDRVAEVRPVDVQQAQAEVESAIASLRRAEANLALGVVKSPIDGQVLKISAHPGEMVSEEEGIAELGNTQQMLVVAEVYESDIAQVELGQEAIIKSEGGAFTEELTGTVAQIGLQIGKKDVLDTDPAADVDARVVEVDILLNPEDSEKVAGLTNSQVVVEILL